MKKIVLTFGLISGAILSAFMAVTFPFLDAIGSDRGYVVGYTSMVVAFLLIYFGVRSYRDNVAGGTVRFGRAFAVGALIGVVASVCYVATWEVIYFKFAPDFLVKYQAHEIEKAREWSERAGARPEESGNGQVRGDVPESGDQLGDDVDGAAAGGVDRRWCRPAC